MLSLANIRCFRRDGKLVIEIPEQAALDLVTKIEQPGEISLDVEDREQFFDGLTQRLPAVEEFHDDHTEQLLRRLLRQAAYDAASHELGVYFNQSMVD